MTLVLTCQRLMSHSMLSGLVIRSLFVEYSDGGYMEMPNR